MLLRKVPIMHITATGKLKPHHGFWMDRDLTQSFATPAKAPIYVICPRFNVKRVFPPGVQLNGKKPIMVRQANFAANKLGVNVRKPLCYFLPANSGHIHLSNCMGTMS